MEHDFSKLIRADRDLIISIIPENSHVLDLGCGDGGLLAELIERKKVIGRGFDIDQRNLLCGLERGLSVTLGDLDEGLADYPDKSYDYAILNQTLQVIKKPGMVLREMLRIGNYAIVGFPNFGHWLLRWRFLIGGRMPKSDSFPFEWYNTPNIHPLTIKDFKHYCRSVNITIIREEYLMFGKWRHSLLVNPFANTCAVTGMFVLKGT